ncbi:MAG: glycerophosphodiester phosphodiesterase family protein, partial [Candidatus Tectomicrobia bacterium]|nr:glycerophosphodiester phosphodiesterase family protein [Candidatus Tectomicrobia bacterium]
LQRLTGSPGEVGDRTLAELRQLNAAATYKDRPIEPQLIPTLQEVFALVQGRTGVQIEIKLRSDNVRHAGIEAKVVELVRQYDMLDDVLVISFDFPTLHEITALEPRLQTAALFSREYLSQFGVVRDEAVVAALQAEGFCRVGANHRYMTPSLYHTLRKHGFSVGVWTVNEEPDISRFADMGMDFVTSDRPDLLLKWIPSSSR